jgi:hypothetical protein
MSNREPSVVDCQAGLTCFWTRKAASYGLMSPLNSILTATALLALGVPAGAQSTPAAKPKAEASTSVGQAKTTTATKPAATAATTAKKPKPPTVAKRKNGKKIPEPQVQAQAQPRQPPPPPTPAQLPPTAPRVSMHDGMLTIEANNSTLADVLAGVRRETKAAIDLPPGASGERVVASLGPGTPQSVLTALLNGSRFDYIILGSEDQPDAVQRVILRAKSGPEPGASAVAANGNQPNGGNRVQPAQPEQQDQDEGIPTEEAPDDSNNTQQPQQEIDNEQSEQQQQNQQQVQQQNQQNQQQPGVKTPEQLLEELRQMQQQQQQNQQQQQQQPQQPAPDEQ